MLYIDPFFLIFIAFLLLVVPYPWLLAAGISGAFHEICHIAAIYLIGGKVQKITVGLGKTVIDTHFHNAFSEMLCALAGPAGSLFLVLFSRQFPRLALCGMIQGLFNLLPIAPMDGGRILRCLLSMVVPTTAEVFAKMIEVILYLFLIIAGFYGCFCHWTKPIPLFALLLFLLIRKKPCKHVRIGIQ